MKRRWRDLICSVLRGGVENSIAGRDLGSRASWRLRGFDPWLRPGGAGLRWPAKQAASRPAMDWVRRGRSGVGWAGLGRAWPGSGLATPGQALGRGEIGSAGPGWAGLRPPGHGCPAPALGWAGLDVINRDPNAHCHAIGHQDHAVECHPTNSVCVSEVVRGCDAPGMSSRILLPSPEARNAFFLRWKRKNLPACS